MTAGDAYGKPTTGSTTVGVCLYDSSGRVEPLIALAIPGGETCGTKPCWKAGSSGYRYRNEAAIPGGVVSLKLRVTSRGEAKIAVKGKGANLPMPALGLIPPVTAQLVVDTGTTTECWQAVFDAALANDPTRFQAHSP